MPDRSENTQAERRHGTFFDGRTAEAHPITVNVLTQGIQIYGERAHSFGFWSFDGLKPHPELTSADEAQIMHAEHPDARLVITDPAIIAQLRNMAPDAMAQARRPRSALGLIGKVALIIAIILVIVLVLVPRGAGLIARVIPAEWEAEWGQSIAEKMAGEHKVCVAPEGRRALDALTKRLLDTPQAKSSTHPITVRVIEAKAQNAFATMGGQIVIFSKLIEEMDGPDELAGVLAHEIGHVTARHPITGAIEATVTMLFASLFGGGSDVGAGMANLGGYLAITSHSRAKEREADTTAFEILTAARISPDGLIDFFKRLQAAHKGGGPTALSLLSTHPALGERMAELKARGGGTGETTPALSRDQWLALKRICE